MKQLTDDDLQEALSPFTADELDLLNRLGECANEFYKLPDMHVSHKKDFVDAIHLAQRLVLIRPGKRMQSLLSV